MAYGTALTALADPTRRRILERLKAGPQSVGAIARRMPVSRPAVSQHLKVLKEAGLVGDRPDGARRVYYIDPNGLGECAVGSMAFGPTPWSPSRTRSQPRRPRRGGRSRESHD